MFGVGQYLRVNERKQILAEEMPKLHAVLRRMANLTPMSDEPVTQQPEKAPPAPRKMAGMVLIDAFADRQ